MATINGRKIGTGGFYLPTIYQKNQKYVEGSLEQGEIDYAELTKWNFPDEFLCFTLESKLLDFVDRCYPNPREKNEVPVWFIISCQFVLRLHQKGNYHNLQYLLNAGSILTKFGFNVGSKNIGFNKKNKKPRKEVIHYDTVRKFFKDTKCEEIRSWYRHDLQQWFNLKRTFDHRGIFILDQSKLVVPDNENYKDAVKMPVDEHGHFYKGLKYLTDGQKQLLVYHPCYTFSTLMNVGLGKDWFHIAGYEFGPGNEDELVQAERLVPDFCRKFRGVMKTLIVDRGYIDGEFIGKIKKDHAVDVLIPLRNNMDDYKEAISIANMKNEWEVVERQENKLGKMVLQKAIAFIPELDLWGSLNLKAHAIATRYTEWDPNKEQYEENYGVLVSTKKYSDPKMMIVHYDLRVQTEERFRQFKQDWYIANFPSPHPSLIESHICFTLLTYSLLQLYLRRKDLQEMTNKMISTLREDERLGKDAVLIYAKEKYGVFDLDDYTMRVAGLKEVPREKLIGTMEAQKEARLKREKED